MTIRILHLSDIQYGRHHVDKEKRPRLYDSDEYSPQLDKLIADLKFLANQGVKPNFIAVTGDIAEWSLEEEYAEAERFLGGLAEHLGIDRRRVVMVPGNHDINRDLCMAARAMARARKQRFEPPYFPKFDLYAEFFHRFYEAAAFPPDTAPYRFTEDRLFVNFPFKEEGIVFAGLNSCIDESEEDPHYGNITVPQLKRACAGLNAVDPERKLLRVALMHHNFLKSSEGDPESLRDADDIKPMLMAEGFSLILHGHQHVPRQEVTGRGDTVIHVLATGSAGLDGETIPEIARRYQVIEIEGGRVRVWRRCFDNSLPSVTGKGAWKPDLGPDQAALYDEFRLPFKIADTTETSAAIADDAPLIIPQAYLDWLARSCAWMYIDNLYDVNSEINVSLPKVFIPLYARPPKREDERVPKAGPDMMERQPPVDIETLIMDEPFLLIEGQAGSGKTTLLRHFCHAAARDGGGLLPVLIFLSDIQAPETARRACASAFEKILDDHFAPIDCGLTAESVKAFCKQGRAVLMLDGLDEIRPDLRDWVVESLYDFRERSGAPKVVLAGRPHGIAGAAKTRFIDGKVIIESLVETQVETFVRNWFCHVPDPKQVTCRSTAEDLLAAMRAHEHLDEMKDTPLMLTAVCMLWYDGKVLPEQRVELYDKFVTFLLKKRFGNSERERRFLMTLALHMHLTLKERRIDALLARELMQEVYPREPAETEGDHADRLKREFRRIEANCGLIRVEQGRYLFWHLSFQAYLAALALMNQSRDRIAAIEDLWEDEWFAEFIPLYIDLLSMKGNNREAHDIVMQQLERDGASPFVRWRLSAAAMQGIHKDWREESAMEDARARMLEVMCRADAAAVVRADAGEILGRLNDPRDLKAFVKIPGGRYRLSIGEKEIAPFEIGKYPVTNAWFREFVEGGGYTNTDYWTPEGRKWLAHTRAETPAAWHDRKWNNPSAPVVGVCWYEAAAFTEWVTKTQDDGYRYFLPDETQWETVAAGKEGREYPWGEWQKDHCNSEEAGLKKTSVTGVFSGGDTPENVCDMAGNIWEWTRSDYHSKAVLEDFPFDPEMQALYERIIAAAGEEQERLIDTYSEKLNEKSRRSPVLRGGSWYYGRDGARCAFRFGGFPFYRNDGAGFRCART